MQQNQLGARRTSNLPLTLRRLLATATALAALAAYPVAVRAAAAPATWPEEVPNFSLLDLRGRYFEFHHTAAPVMVLFFTENGCPIARQALHKLHDLREAVLEKDVEIWAVDANPGDNRESIAKEANELATLGDQEPPQMTYSSAVSSPRLVWRAVISPSAPWVRQPVTSVCQRNLTPCHSHCCCNPAMKRWGVRWQSWGK